MNCVWRRRIRKLFLLLRSGDVDTAWSVQLLINGLTDLRISLALLLKLGQKIDSPGRVPFLLLLVSDIDDVRFDYHRTLLLGHGLPGGRYNRREARLPPLDVGDWSDLLVQDEPQPLPGTASLRVLGDSSLPGGGS